MDYQEVLLHYREKCKYEQQYFEIYRAKGYNHLQIASMLLDIAATFLKEIIKQGHPDWDDPQILYEMRRIIKNEDDFQHRRRIHNIFINSDP